MIPSGIVSDRRVRVDCYDIGWVTVFLFFALVVLLAKPIANQIHQGWL
jgi:hypothetical protein